MRRKTPISGTIWHQHGLFHSIYLGDLKNRRKICNPGERTPNVLAVEVEVGIYRQQRHSHLSTPIMSVVRLISYSLLLAIGQAAYIVPGGRWYDTSGNIVNAHAGCVIADRNSSKYYLFGEYKPEGHVEGAGVAVYSSEDLATWENHGLALGVLFSP